MKVFKKNETFNAAKTSMSNCHVYTVTINKAGKMHKLKLTCIFLVDFAQILFPGINRTVPMTMRDNW